MPALTLTDVRKNFGSTAALAGLSVQAERGKITAVLGPNGAGKTTMVRCCTGLVSPDAGSISVLGGQPGTRETATKIGLMPQAVGAWSYIKAGELLAYLAQLSANPQPVAELADLLGLQDLLETPYRRLSGGQQQSVNLAAALVGRPELVFLDEPTAGLDPRVKRTTWEVIADLRDAGVAVLLTTHQMDEAQTLADQVYIMDQGKVTISGTVKQLTATSSLEEVFLAHTTARIRP